KVFAEYPNVINEIINLSLSNGEALSEGDQTFERTNEFLEQFESGQAKEIDTAICDSLGGCNSQRWFSLTARNVNEGQIQGVINKLWGENYVLWGGREGYETLLNTDLRQER
ncbi:DUF4092 domain-containing protein, partial [Enterobacter hormaechei subsp. steigerwaltii]|nr:DUF4092 domain-containing protein [Enterobacter hormaechei subsp. steigerwaltii]